MRNIFSQAVFATACAIALAVPAEGWAATANATSTVTLNLATGCTIQANALDFGTLTLKNLTTVNAQTKTTTLVATCGPGATFTVILSSSLNGTASQPVMKGSSGTGSLAYGLYLDAALTTAFPTATANATTITANGTPQSYTVYGNIPEQAATYASAYSDTLTFTITY